MAGSGKNADGSGGGWWGNFLAAAKEQTGKVYEMVSNDLTEFTSVMQNDTKLVVEKTKETLKTSSEKAENVNTTDRMKQSFHSLMSGITKALTVDPEDTSPPKPSASQPATGIFDRAKARMRAVQVDTGTYLQEPSGSPEKYADWLKSFDLDAHKGDISDLLVTMVEVRSLYTTLVPSQVSHQDFWRRYFYKVHQLRMDEERKKALMKRAERVDVKEDTIDWDEEEWSGDEDASPSKKQPQSKKEESLTSRLQAEESTEERPKAEKPIDVEQAKAVDSEQEQTLPSERPEKNSDSSKLKKEDCEETIKSIDKNLDDKSKALNNEKSDTQEVMEKGPETEKIEDSSVDKIVDSCDKLNELSLGTKVQDTSVVTEQDTHDGKDLEQKKTIDAGEKSEVGSEPCNKDTGKTEDTAKEKELETKEKGDMVVVGDRISPSSDSSGGKDSSNDDWERDFDVDVTPEDLAAASELAQKMNMSATEYNKLTGEEEDDDWENWD